MSQEAWQEKHFFARVRKEIERLLDEYDFVKVGERVAAGGDPSVHYQNDRTSISLYFDWRGLELWVGSNVDKAVEGGVGQILEAVRPSLEYDLEDAHFESLARALPTWLSAIHRGFHPDRVTETKRRLVEVWARNRIRMLEMLNKEKGES